ncbi:MAG: ABC transporter permease [Chloroflexota bacterium]
MRSTLLISKREITRLRTRFTGKSRIGLVAIILLAAVLSYTIYNQDFGLSRDLYTVGVSPGAPSITGEQFNVISVEPDKGHAMLSEKRIDVYIGKTTVFSREDERSKQAVGALKKYLEKEELVRIAQTHDIDEAFPLRIEVRHSPVAAEARDNATRASLSDILDSGTGASTSTSASSSTSESRSSPAAGQEVEGESSSPQSSPVKGEDTSPNGESAPSLEQETEGNLPDEMTAADQAVQAQLEEYTHGSSMPEFQAEFARDEEIIVPSLSQPPMPLAQVLIAFFYIIPTFIVSVFFTSSFMEEKIGRKLLVLLSSPVTPFQIILGKMLPYIGYSLVAIVAITLILGGEVFLSLAIFTPVILFVLSVLLMVALLYRTFKDQTFFSVLAGWLIIVYLVAPAMFTGVSEISFISPLTLAVQMYRGESFGMMEYLLATLPLYLSFLVTMFVGVRIFNEEYLMGFRSLHRKMSEAIYLAIDRDHLNISVFCLSLLLIPLVLMVEFASIVVALNLSVSLSLVIILGVSVVGEEIGKSAGIVVLLQNGVINSFKSVLKFSFLAALGFLVGEKALLYVTMSVVSKSQFIEAAFGSGFLALPLVLHFACTSAVCLLTARLGIKYYPLGIAAGAVIHGLYNLFVVMGVLS